jgi:CRISPR-associated protein (TIGR03984 family)
VPDQVRVHRWGKVKVSLPQGVAEFLPLSGGGVLGFLMTPSKLFVVKLNGDRFEGPEGDIVAADVYEARLFGPRAELRWVREPDGGRAAIVVEEDGGSHVPHGWSSIDSFAAEPHDHGYVLWGRKDETVTPPRGWWRFSEARTGPLLVPGEGSTPMRGQLRAREYWVEDDAGNIYVREERLLGIEPLEGDG